MCSFVSGFDGVEGTHRESNVRLDGGETARPVQSDIDEIISFYVTNIPRDVNRSKLWKPCAKLGRLVDICIPGKRDEGGSFFAFAKFTKVANTYDIVKGLNEILIGGLRVKANISKHPRKPPPQVIRKKMTPNRPSTRPHLLKETLDLLLK
ncbi:unnamed protein product [Lactuca virosa]|uniref:RRM domain-containing protein n=1 Tax=Lactuca virosa TaxID=75947 RepID=A0AAU9PEI9_9ASTR|nr:unnamed protein product [Lactuca virosa]